MNSSSVPFPIHNQEDSTKEGAQKAPYRVEWTDSTGTARSQEFFQEGSALAFASGQAGAQLRTNAK